MTLDQYAREGATLEIRVPWLEATLWFVPDEGYAEALVRDGVSRGRIWMARELATLLMIQGRTGAATRAVTLAKRTSGGEVAEVTRRRAQQSLIGVES